MMHEGLRHFFFSAAALAVLAMLVLAQSIR